MTYPTPKEPGDYTTHPTHRQNPVIAAKINDNTTTDNNPYTTTHQAKHPHKSPETHPTQGNMRFTGLRQTPLRPSRLLFFFHIPQCF